MSTAEGTSPRDEPAAEPTPGRATQTAEEKPLKPPPAERRWFAVMRRVLLVAALLAMVGFVALGVVVRRYNLFGDFAVGNVFFLICSFLAILAPIGWVSLFALRGWYRLSPPAVLIALIAAFFLFVKIREVNGEMIPVFAWRFEMISLFHWRFARDPDERLAQPETTGDGEAAPIVDLKTTTDDDFPRFLGPGGTQHVKRLRLARDWETNPPQLVWRHPIGAGWSAFAIVNGYAVTMEQRGPQELVTCYDVKTGELKWSQGVEARYETILGGIGPRATPTIDDGKVYANGATGILRCIDGDTGKLNWQKDLLEVLDIPADHDAASVLYGRANSPLVYGNLVVVPGGAGPDAETMTNDAVSLVAFDKRTGELRWRGGHEQIGYASPVLATIDQVEQVITVNESSVSGHDSLTGRQLWEFPWPGGSAANSNNSQPVAVGRNRVLVSKSYGVGAALMEIRQGDAGKWSVKEVWHEPGVLKTKFTNVVVDDGYVYALSDGILECVDLDSGERVWKKGRFHQGQILGVGGVLLVVNETTGDVSMVDMTPTGFEELGRFHALDSSKVWNHLALYGKYLLVRDAQTAACWELTLTK